jgi:hypothetical protein
MIKILFEHGYLFEKESPYALKVIAINQDNKNYCDVIDVFPYLSKLSKKDKKDLFETISYMIECVSRNTLKPKKGLQYVEPISKLIREKYKNEFDNIE